MLISSPVLHLELHVETHTEKLEKYSLFRNKVFQVATYLPATVKHLTIPLLFTQVFVKRKFYHFQVPAAYIAHNLDSFFLIPLKLTNYRIHS